MISALTTFIRGGVATTLTFNFNPDLYIIEGQSNAVGVVSLASLPGDIPNPIPNVRTFNRSGSVWQDITLGTNSGGTTSATSAYGVEARLMRDLQLLKGRTQYLIKFAQSDTPLNITGSQTDWAASHNTELFGDSNTNYTAAIAGLVDKRPPRAYIWIQGENDANAGFAGNYQTNLQNFIAGKRTYYNSPSMPFIIVQLSTAQSGLNATHRNTVMAAQATVGAQANNYLVSTSGLTTTDGVHYDATSYNTIATRILDTLLSVPG